MSKDTIYRQDAVDAINELHDKPNAWLDLAVEILEKLPSAQPERLKGHWIRVGDGCTDYFKCSECGELSDYEDNFCCDCGADMREG